MPHVAPCPSATLLLPLLLALLALAARPITRPPLLLALPAAAAAALLPPFGRRAVGLRKAAQVDAAAVKPCPSAVGGGSARAPAAHKQVRCSARRNREPRGEGPALLQAIGLPGLPGHHCHQHSPTARLSGRPATHLRPCRRRLDRHQPAAAQRAAARRRRKVLLGAAHLGASKGERQACSGCLARAINFGRPCAPRQPPAARGGGGVRGGPGATRRRAADPKKRCLAHPAAGTAHGAARPSGCESRAWGADAWESHDSCRPRESFVPKGSRHVM